MLQLLKPSDKLESHINYKFEINIKKKNFNFKNLLNFIEQFYILIGFLVIK